MISLLLIDPAAAHYRRTSVAVLFVLLVVLSVACAKRSPPTALTTAAANNTSPSATTKRININTASAKDLEVLPGIGKGLAERIVEHREKYGPFRRAEHLMMVRGISETRFRALRHLIAVE